MLFFARERSAQPVLIADLAKQERIPKKFLEQILLELKNSGFLQSKMGKGGGYYLKRRPETITFGQIIRLFDGPIAPVSCVSQTAYQPCEECADEMTCALRLVMKDVRDSIAGILDRTTLKSAIDQSDQLAMTSAERLTYYI